MTTPKQPHATSVALPTYRIFIISCLLLFLVSALPVFALSNPSSSARGESAYALIFGTVWGADSRPAYGVKVAIRRADDKKARWHLISDHNGEFAQRVPAGRADYLVWAEAVPGKRAKSSENKELAATTTVKVHIENDERTDIGLHLTE